MDIKNLDRAAELRNELEEYEAVLSTYKHNASLCFKCCVFGEEIAQLLPTSINESFIAAIRSRVEEIKKEIEAL